MAVSDDALALRMKGHSYAEIADALKISENSARVLVWKKRHPAANAYQAWRWRTDNPERARAIAKKSRERRKQLKKGGRR